MRAKWNLLPERVLSLMERQVPAWWPDMCEVAVGIGTAPVRSCQGSAELCSLCCVKKSSYEWVTVRHVQILMHFFLICVSSESFHDQLRPALSPVTARFWKYCSRLRFLDKLCLCDLSGLVALTLKILLLNYIAKPPAKTGLSNTERTMLNVII